MYSAKDDKSGETDYDILLSQAVCSVIRTSMVIYSAFNAAFYLEVLGIAVVIAG
jgi:hypothetical protein